MRNCSSLFILCGCVSACKVAKPNMGGKLVAKPRPSVTKTVTVNSADNPCVEAVAGQAELCYDAAEYPDDEMMQAMEGIPSYLGGMFNNYVGESLELRSGESDGWTYSVQACGGISVYIRPRLARNNRGKS
jgi:hypothetical protein